MKNKIILIGLLFSQAIAGATEFLYLKTPIKDIWGIGVHDRILGYESYSYYPQNLINGPAGGRDSHPCWLYFNMKHDDFDAPVKLNDVLIISAYEPTVIKTNGVYRITFTHQ